MEGADLFLQRCEDSSGYFCCIGGESDGEKASEGGKREGKKLKCVASSYIYMKTSKWNCHVSACKFLATQMSLLHTLPRSENNLRIHLFPKSLAATLVASGMRTSQLSQCYNNTVGIRPTNKHFCTETTVPYKTPRAKRPSKRRNDGEGRESEREKRERHTVRKRGGTVVGGREEIEIQLASHPNTTFLSVPGNLRPSANQRAPFGLSIRSSAPTSVPPMLCGEVLFRPPAPGPLPPPSCSLSVRSGAKNWS
ncbi:hypothetical protein CEXT_429791 [Caerostris extrusa]|uniref:Uncharacterized protein n=1 Tax=Caerostris extrusa TaxID=172846 RepID=A0AAV4PXV5_CAEEX|nr:hypothetical protein CEXT_429791 [Caerostris extrusa]